MKNKNTKFNANERPKDGRAKNIEVCKTKSVTSKQ